MAIEQLGFFEHVHGVKSSTDEAELQRLVHILIRTYGGKLWSVPDSRKLEPGWPDTIAFFPAGSSFLVEFKRQDGKLRKQQMDKIDWLRAHGYTVYVWRPRDYALGIIEREIAKHAGKKMAAITQGWKPVHDRHAV